MRHTCAIRHEYDVTAVGRNRRLNVVAGVARELFPAAVDEIDQVKIAANWRLDRIDQLAVRSPCGPTHQVPALRDLRCA